MKSNSKFWGVMLLFILISSCFLLYGQDEEVVLNADPVGYWPPHVYGDRDFHGHGPHVTAEVQISISNNGKKINGEFYLRAKETESNWTRYEGSKIEQLKLKKGGIKWEVPSGYKIVRIVTPISSEADYTDHNMKLDFPTPHPREGLVKRFEIMGDKFGDDYPCMEVFFNEIRVKIRRE